MNLQQAVFAGLVDAGKIVIVREILSNPDPGDIDTALFSGPSSDYTITANPDGSVTVDHTAAIGGGGGGGGGANDGIDTLWNIELLAFTDGTFPSPVSLCKLLTISHTGSGSDPIAAPVNSFGCAAGLYLPGEVIALSSAAPDAGFQVSGWTGTDNNATNAETNIVTMPTVNHNVSVAYVDTAPVVVSSVRVNSSPTALSSVSYIVTFSEAVTGVDATDFTLNPTITGASVTGVAGTGTTRTVTVNTGSISGAIRLNVLDDDTIVDALGTSLGDAGLVNGDFTGGEAYTVDKSGPVAGSIVRASASPSSAASVNYTVTFSEAVSGVDTADFAVTVTGGISGASVSSVTGTGATRTVVVNTGSGSGTLRLDLMDNDTITDGLSNPFGGTGVQNYTSGQVYTINKDLVPPTVNSIVRASVSPSGAASVNYTVTFSESVTGVDVADFAVTVTGGVSGASVASVTGSGATRTVVVNTGSGSGTLRLDLMDNNSILDASSNPVGGAGVQNFITGQVYTIDKTAPIVIWSVRASASPSGAASVNYTVRFSEAVTGVDVADFALTVTGGVSGASVASVTGSGVTRTVVVNTGSGSGTLRLDLMDNNSVIDASSNPLGGVGVNNFITGQVYTIDKTGPVVSSIVRASASPSGAASVNYTVTFSEAVTGVDVADFAVTVTGGVSGASVASVTGSGATRTVVVNTGSGSGTLRLDLMDDNSVIDASSNLLGGAGAQNFTTGQVYTLDKSLPTVISIVRASASPSGAASVNYTVRFSEAVTGVDVTDFALTVTGGISGASVVSVTGTGTTRTVTVNTGSGSGTLRLDLMDDNSVMDASSNTLGGVGAQNFITGQVYTINKP